MGDAEEKEQQEQEQETLLLDLDYVWPNGEIISTQYLTCKNHQELRWLTKNPWSRHLHFVSRDTVECPCAFEDLRVIVQ